ncbi:sulfite exporter TauE/SafE family protein [Massilia sp. 9096]|uniref:sulfite exporter TauE/SafE family protein n=1 Tax=Massilia sp. 9096 TaxID=1500894 RepID=UPI00055F2829|nr:sulfite exporter TauE/SafE family protein [Massilia sp. 9096]
MLLSLLLGAVVGVIMGLTGAGGGILAVPLLVFGQRMTVVAAGPVALLAVGAGAALGAWFGLRTGIVRYRAAMLVAAIGIAASPAGVWLAARLDTRLLTLVFAAVLALVAAKGLRDATAAKRDGDIAAVRRACRCDPHTGRLAWTTGCAGRLSVMGAAAGLLSGLLGVGGGFVVVPALQRFTDLDMRATVATSLAVITLISFAGVAVSVHGGHFDLGVGVPFGAGTVLGVLGGGRLASRWPPRHLKAAFAIVCLAVAAGLAVKILA